MSVTLSRDELKQVFKEAVVELLHEQHDLLHEVVMEVIEEIGLAKAMDEGRKSDLVSEEEVMQVLRGEQ